MSEPKLDPLAIFTSRQAAHALGITDKQLQYMRLNGEITPTWQGPGNRGMFWYERAEIERVLKLSDRRTFRRRRKAAQDPPMGLQLVQPRPRRRHLPAPPT